MKKTLVTIGAILVAVLLVVWAYSAAQRRNLELEAQKEREVRIEKELKLEECMENAHSRYSSNWDKACSMEGLGDNCSLPIWRADDLDAGLESDELKCVELYK